MTSENDDGTHADDGLSMLEIVKHAVKAVMRTRHTRNHPFSDTHATTLSPTHTQPPFPPLAPHCTQPPYPPLAPHRTAYVETDSPLLPHA